MQDQRLFQDAQQLHRKGRLSHAKRRYDKLLEEYPDHNHGRLFRAILLQQMGQVRDAVAEADKAMENMSNPDSVIRMNYGVILKNVGRLADAEYQYQKALEASPNNPNIKSNLATLQMLLGRTAEAENKFLELTKEIEEPAPWLNLARISLNREDWEQTKEYLQRAEDIDPSNPDMHQLQAQLAFSLRDHEGTFERLKKVFERQPANREAWELLQRLDQDALDPKAMEQVAQALVRVDAQSASVLSAAVAFCRKNLVWNSLLELEDRLADALSKPFDKIPSTSATFTLLSANVPQWAQLQAAKATWQALTAQIQQKPPRELLPRSQRSDRIRVAILSSDLRGHAGGTLLVGLVENFPREKIELFAYSNSFDDHSEFRTRLRSGFDRFINIAKLNDRELADKLRQDEIDILIDRNGMTRDTRVLVTAFRPAPVQLTYLAFPGSVGAGGDIDYIITDPWVVQQDNIDGFNESIIQLPRCYQPNDHVPPSLEAAGTRADHKLPEESVVFCSFNQHYKYSPDNFRLWCEVLRRVENSVLWVLKPLTKAIEDQLKAHLEAEGIDSARVIFAPPLPHDRHIARISHADLVLDTYPYNAHTTASDALRVGVPVVTLPGKTFASRVAASILDHSNMPEWISNSPEEYVEKAVEYASRSRQEIEETKEKVRETYWNSSMVDNKAYGKIFEALCLQLYDHHAEGKSRQHLRLTPDLELEPLDFVEVKENKSVPELAGQDAQKSVQAPREKEQVVSSSRSGFNLVLWDPSDRVYSLDTPNEEPVGGMKSAFVYFAEALAQAGHNVYFHTNSQVRGEIRGVYCQGHNPQTRILEEADAVLVVGSVNQSILEKLRSHLQTGVPIAMWTGHAANQPAVQSLKDKNVINLLDVAFVKSKWHAWDYQTKLGVPQSKIGYLVNAVPPQVEEIAREIREDPLKDKTPYPSLIYTSTPFRGFDQLLKSFPYIKKELPDAELNVYTGMGIYKAHEQDAKFEHLYRQAEAMEGVNHHYPVAQPQLAEQLRKTWVFAYPCTFEETSCKAVMEGMGAGLGIVSTNLGSLPEDTAGFGKLIDLSPKDPEFPQVFAEEVVDTCRKIQNGDPEIREKLKNQVDFVLDNYVWSKRAKEFEEWLRGWKQSANERLDSESEIKEELPFETTKVQASVKGKTSFNVIIPKREQFRIREVLVNEDYALPRELQVKPGMTIVDVGANVGCFALYASTWAKNLNIHCFEPNPQVQEMLRENLKPIEKDHNVKIHPFALGEKDDELKLSLDPNNTGRASFVRDHPGKQLSCSIRNAEAAFKEAGIETIDVLKIDVEGYEAHVLRGLGSYLSKVKNIMLEFHREHERREIDTILDCFNLYSARIENLRGSGILKYVKLAESSKKKTEVQGNVEALHEHTKRGYHDSSPNINALEITTKIGCINKCEYCPQNRLIESYKKLSNETLMSFETFSECLDKLDNNTVIAFTGFSEPFSNPQCIEMMEYAHKQGFKLHISTTLIGVKEKYISRLEEINFSYFGVHLPGQNPYKEFKADEEYTALLSKIINSRIKNKRYHYYGDNIHPSAVIAKDVAKRLVLHSRAGNLSNLPHNQKKGPVTCRRNFSQPVLLPNGDITLCCMDYGLDYILGNLKHSSLEQIYNSAAFKHVIELTKQDKGSICHLCDGFAISTKKKNRQTRKILVVGFPKAGTSTISRALSLSGVKEVHWRVKEGRLLNQYVGALMHQGYYQHNDPWYYLKEYQAITQADVCIPDKGLNYWPHFDFNILERIKELYPSCLFVLNYRDPQKIVPTMLNWGDLQARFTKADIPGLPPGKGNSPEELQAWIENHYAKIREFFKGDDNFLEIDIESEHAPKILGDKLGIEIKWWGKANVNPEKQNA